ncbi:MAG: hypothetical protein DRO05_08620 [Thermoproteota archaeon]|nr:MAG: hypothetical protein DRO05_08620 [Candidatus Korarchaeota archaeon]
MKLRGACEGAIQETLNGKNRLKMLKERGRNCPVLECAVKRGVGRCDRDCESYPCRIHREIFPYSQEYVDLVRERLKRTRI